MRVATSEKTMTAPVAAPRRAELVAVVVSRAQAPAPELGALPGREVEGELAPVPVEVAGPWCVSLN